MSEQNELQIPNTDFSNDKGMVSLSFVKKDGGFYMRENFSKKEYAISNPGQINATVNNVGREMLIALERMFKEAKVNDVLTTEFQIRKGGLAFLFGAGIMSLGTSNSESTMIGQLMNAMLYVLNINPSIFGGKRYKTNREGYIAFIEDIRKNQSSNRGFGEGPGFVNDSSIFGPQIREINNYNSGPGFFQTGGQQDSTFIDYIEDTNLSENKGEQTDNKGRLRV